MGNHGLSGPRGRGKGGPPDGRLQLLVWDDKGMGMSRRNSINVTGYFACPVWCAMPLYSVGALWVIGGQHGVAVCDEICKDVTARMGEVEDSMTNFDMRVIKFDTSVEIRRKLAGQHNRAQHSGRESGVPQKGQSPACVPPSCRVRL